MPSSRALARKGGIVRMRGEFCRPRIRRGAREAIPGREVPR